MYLTLHQKILSGYLVILILFWILLKFSGQTTSTWNYLYSFLFSLIPLLGGLVGIFLARQWGNLTSAIGRMILFTSIGSFCWGAGSMVWSYYNFFYQISAPYPSIADIGFILALPFWAAGMINLSKATGVRFALQNIRGRLFLGVVPVIVTAFSYYFLVTVARDGVISDSYNNLLKLFFDFAYPLGDVLILTLVVIIFGLSFKYFGGGFRFAVFAILLGFAVMYLADFIFSYTTTTETFYNGNYGDLVFTLALFLITFGVFGFSSSAILKHTDT